MEKNSNESYSTLREIFNVYKLSNNDMKYIYKIIKPIYNHKEFQKRMKPPYLHHGNTTLGEHILGDTILVYLTCKNRKKSYQETRRTILIAMFHDLYTNPWKLATRKEKIRNYHAFTHPIEAIINAINWFPSYFENINDAKIIIDGVLHHMYPLPVRAISKLKLELSNENLLPNIDDKLKKIITLSLRPCLSKNLSLRQPFYFEGRVLVKIDKIITLRKDLKGFKIRKFIKTIYYVIKPIKN